MEKLSSNYKSASLLELLMEYCIMYETDDLSDRPEGGIINEGIAKIINGESLFAMVDRLGAAREDINKKMQVLTAYVDRFMIFEYIFNRIGYKYTIPVEELKSRLSKRDKEQYVNEIIEFIFETKDNVIVNERIRQVTEQLPVRMARSKYFDLVSKNIDLYSKSDRESLDGYVYMLRTAAMIYEPEGMDMLFPELKTAFKEFENLDFKEIHKDYYELLMQKLDAVTEHIRELSDMYMTLQKFINMLYVYALNEEAPDLSGNDINKKCIDAISEIYSAVNMESTKDLITDYLLEGLEGSMEKLYDERNMLEITEGERNEALIQSGKLMSSSLFAPLTNDKPESVTPEYLGKVKEDLINDLKKVIEKYNRLIVRAVFAMTIGKMHIFFKTSEDVYEYVKNAVMSCGDEAELLATYELTDELMVF